MMPLFFPFHKKVELLIVTQVCLGEKYSVADFNVVLIFNLLDISVKSEHDAKFGTASTE